MTQACSIRAARSRWTTSRRAVARAFRIFRWCSSLSLSLSCSAFHLYLMSEKATCSHEQTPARCMASSLLSVVLWTNLSASTSSLCSLTAATRRSSWTLRWPSHTLCLSCLSKPPISLTLMYRVSISSTRDAPSVPVCLRHARRRSKSSFCLASITAFRRMTSSLYALYSSNLSFSFWAAPLSPFFGHSVAFAMISPIWERCWPSELIASALKSTSSREPSLTSTGAVMTLPKGPAWLCH
mmetsp:Transcript_122314/g.346798  ORF Transcript_122314/g.346798 Transcript_122314/m.346798 type:complete len:240 (+) Transcript_122314:1166-1885(+)